MTVHPPGRRAGFSRRSLLRGALALGGAGAAAGLAGCGNAFSAGVAGTTLDPGTVTFWNLFGGGDGARLTTMLDHYEATHGGAKSLQAATFAWGNPYYTKLTLATLGDKPPDVAVSHLTRMKNLAVADLLTPISDDMLSSVGLSASDFNAKAWKSSQVDGKQYAIPLDTHPCVMFYNKTVCQKAGLLDSDGELKPIEGMDAWMSALAAAQKVTGAYGVSMGNVNETATPWRVFQTFYQQKSTATPVLGGGGTRFTANEDDAVDVLAFIQKMSSSGLMPKATDYAGAESMLFTGKTAFYLEGEWEITTAQAVKGLQFGMVPIPQVYDQKAAQADSHTFVLPRMDRTADQTKLAMGFIKSLLDQSMTWAQGGHIPAYLPTKDSAAYKKLTPQSDYAAAADYATYDAPAWYSGSGSTFENTIGAQIGLVQQGLSTPQQALAATKSQLGPYLDTPSPL